MENLHKLKSELPHGYSKVLQKRMLKKHGKKLSTASIRKGLMEAHLNFEILEEAMIFVEEIKKKRERMRVRLNTL